MHTKKPLIFFFEPPSPHSALAQLQELGCSDAARGGAGQQFQQVPGCVAAADAETEDEGAAVADSAVADTEEVLDFRELLVVRALRLPEEEAEAQPEVDADPEAEVDADPETDVEAVVHPVVDVVTVADVVSEAQLVAEEVVQAELVGLLEEVADAVPELQLVDVAEDEEEGELVVEPVLVALAVPLADAVAVTEALALPPPSARTRRARARQTAAWRRPRWRARGATSR